MDRVFCALLHPEKYTELQKGKQNWISVAESIQRVKEHHSYNIANALNQKSMNRAAGVAEKRKIGNRISLAEIVLQ